MPNLYTTRQKIVLANNIVASVFGNNISEHDDPLLIQLRKIEKKYLKSQTYDLNDFCISLTELPKKHFRLMSAIGWLDHETEHPKKSLKGFYKETFHGSQGTTQIKHYITVDAYIKLLFIELEITTLYSSQH